MRRRELIAILGGAVAWPLGARAQQKTVPVIGFLHLFAESADTPTASFRQGLSEVGFVEGQNVAVEHRFADGHYDRLPALAAELAGQPVSVIVALGLPQARAAKGATTTIPIVFWTGGDPIVGGLVTSLSHPGANLTGVGMFNNALGAKRLELLRELLTKAGVFAMLVNPANPNAEPQSKDVQEAAHATGMQLLMANASTDSEIEMAFVAIVKQRTDGLIVAADPYLYSRRARVIALAAQYALPAIYTVREYAVAGGLMSYTSSAPMEYELGSYTGRILKGEKPADLPIQRPTKFTLAINLKTAKTLGLTVPQLLLAQADEVVE
jgi:putative ABC transport system substrate-binding protein